MQDTGRIYRFQTAKGSVIGVGHGGSTPNPETRRKQMSSSTTDQVNGKLHELKGKVKEKAGQVVGNPDLEAEGQNENLAGKVQKKVGQIEKVFEK
jgi:uncharacterized protein YjbJ (UPF0337 family)